MKNTKAIRNAIKTKKAMSKLPLHAVMKMVRDVKKTTLSQ